LVSQVDYVTHLGASLDEARIGIFSVAWQPGLPVAAALVLADRRI
jgi:hypothetical protein